MAHESFSVSEVIPASPDLIYAAWLDEAKHSQFTGGPATVEPFVGGRHTSFDGYAEGTTLELHPGRRIVQTWRSKDFPEGSPDSRLEVMLEETLGGTMVTIQHSEIPSGQAEGYRDGWVKFYLMPLKAFFGGADVGASDDEMSAGGADAEAETEAAPARARVPRAASSRNGAPAKKARKPAAKTKTKTKKRVARRPAAAKAARAKAKGPRKAKAKAKAKARKPAAKKKAPARGGKKRAKKR